MTERAWPFMVSRNRSVDYTAVVLPDFACEAALGNPIRECLDEDDNQGPSYAHCSLDGAGALTIVYRVIIAEDQGNAFLDSVGREIRWLEGVVLKGSERRLRNGPAVLQAAHERMLESYERFWNGGKAPTPSLALDVDVDVELQREPAQEERSTLLSIALTLALVAVFCVIAGVLFVDDAPTPSPRAGASAGKAPLPPRAPEHPLR